MDIIPQASSIITPSSKILDVDMLVLYLTISTCCPCGILYGTQMTGSDDFHDPDRLSSSQGEAGPGAPVHALQPRLVGSFASQFQGWPPQADQAYLALHAKKAGPPFNDPGYFSCDDLVVDTPDQRVHRGVDDATRLYTQWEAQQGEGKQDEAPTLRLPPRFLTLQPDEQIAGEEEEGEGEEMDQSDGGVEESKGSGKRRGGRRPTPSTAQAYPHSQPLQEMLKVLPNHSHLTTQLQHTLLGLRPHLRTAEWKASIEHGGMKDARKVPHLRASSANVASGHSIAHTTAQDEEQDQAQEGVVGRCVSSWGDVLVSVTVLGIRSYIHTKLQEMTLLGTHTLRDLGHAIACTKRQMVALDEGLRHRHAPPPWSAFFIHGTFYIQPTDDADARAYVQHLEDWLQREPGRRHQLGLDEGASLPICSTGLDTPLSSLTLRLGTRYLYLHLGCCEHHFAITDLRLPSQHDMAQRESLTYPISLFQKHVSKQRCHACDTRVGALTVMHDRLAPDARSIYCHACFPRAMNLSPEEGEIRGAAGTVTRISAAARAPTDVMEVYTYIHEH